MVCTLRSFKTTNGHKKSFQTFINVTIPKVAKAGLTAGKTMFQKRRKLLQPSIRPASNRSLEMEAEIYWRIQKAPKALTMAGTITACKESNQPRLLMIMYMGIRPNWTGIIMVAMTKKNKESRPLNSSLAKANPASEQKKRTEAVMVPETTKELKMPRKNWIRSNTCWALSMK